MIIRHRVTRRRSENAIDWTIVIAQLSKLLLGSFDRGISRWDTVINGLRVIVRLTVCVVIVRVVVVGVIRKVIPRVESVIQSAPEATDKDKEATVIKMGMSPIPVAVPVCLMTFGDMIRPPVQSALRKCSRRTRG